jgi:hypothetical protein
LPAASVPARAEDAVTEVFALLPSRAYRWDAEARKAVLGYGKREEADEACRKVFVLARERPEVVPLFVQAAHSWLCRKASDSSTLDDQALAALGPEAATRLCEDLASLKLLEGQWPRSRAGRPDAAAPAGPVLGIPASFGHFRTLCELGRGGHGVVLLAFDPALKRDAGSHPGRDALERDPGDAPVHGPRAGGRPDGRGRAGHRRVRAGGHSVRGADGPDPLYRNLGVPLIREK